MEGEVIPVYGQGFFHIARGIIYYTIVYDYLERGSAGRVVDDPALRREEEDYIAKSMQELMDEERIIINGEEVRCIVDTVLLERRGRRLHSAVIHARMQYRPRPGNNVYENFYEAEEEAPYPYTVYWVAPPGGRIVSVDTPGDVEMRAGGRIAVIRVARGTALSGYEAVVFRLGR